MGFKFFGVALVASTFFGLVPFFSAAQAVGDYQTDPQTEFFGFGTVTWTSLNDWQRWNGATWATPTGGQGYPGQFSVPTVVTIRFGDLTNLNVSVTLGTLTLDAVCTLDDNANENLTINTALSIAGFSTMTLNGSGTFLVSGTTSNDGTFQDGGNGGVSTFVGLVTNTGTFTSTAVTTTANMIFWGGIANTGTVNAGGATFNTNDQAISGTGATSFANNVLINAVTLTNSNTGDLLIGGTTTFQTSGGFTDNANSGTDTFGGAVNIVAGTTFTTTAVTTTANVTFRGGIANAGTFAAGGATFNTNAQTVSGSTALTFANNVAITASVVNVTNTSNFTVTGTTTITAAGGFTDSNNTGITTFIGNVSLAAGTSFTSTAVATTANLIFRGGIANSGTFTGGGATFNTNNQALTGTGDTAFANNILINAITLTNSNTGNLIVGGTTTLQTSGGFTDSTNTGTETFVGNVSIPAGTNFISTASTTVGFLEFRGGIDNNGTFTAGGATFTTNGQTVSGTTGLSFANNVAITGSLVTVTNTSTFLVTGTTTLTVSGGFTDSSNGAGSVTTFVGNVSVGAGTAFTSTAITTVANMVFRGGIANDGTFNGGSATFNTNAQALTGSVKITFTTNVVVTTITVTNSNAASVDLTNAAAGSLSGTGGWTQGASSTLNYTGTTITVTTFTASGAGNTVDYNGTTAAVTVRAPATTYHHLTLSGTGNITKTLAANTIVSGNLTIANTAIFSVSTFTLSVGGNWTNTSTDTDPFVQGAQTVTFVNTTTAQTISNTGNALGTEFNNVVFNNTSAAIPQITISNAVVVRNSLTMTSGIIDLNSTTFTLGVAGTASTLVRNVATTTTNWVYNGSFKRFWVANIGISSVTPGNLYGMFPLGSSTASSFRPVQINTTVTPTADGTFTTTHTEVTGVTDLTPNYSDGGTNIVRKHNAKFVTAITGGTGGTFSISATMTGLLAGTLGNIRLAIHTGVAASTTASAVGTHAAATGTAPNPTATRTGITTLADLNNDFRISSTNIAQTPLPVQLTSFAATLMNDEVLLNWRTATELNNDYFSVERGQTIESFTSIITVSGNGTSKEPHSYSANDATPIYGRSYYRLKQTDYDGKSSYSDVVVIDYEGPRFATLRAYPNPSTGQTVTIRLTGLKDQGSVPIQIMSMRGQIIYQDVLEIETPGTLQHELQFNSPLNQGMYIIKAGETLQLSQKLIVN